MDPDTFEEIVITQFYGLNSLPDVQLNEEERIAIRSSIQQCLKTKILRANKTRSGVDKRRSGANEVLAIYHGCGDATTPKEKLKAAAGKQGETKIDKVYNKTYHEDAKNLFLETEVLTQEYSFDQSDWLCRSGQRLSHDEFLKFIRERLSLESLTELKSTEPLTGIPYDTEKQDKRNIISFALKVVLGRTYSDMAVVSERYTDEQTKNHREAIAELAVYTAILDAIHHKKYETCGIEDVVESSALLPSP